VAATAVVAAVDTVRTTTTLVHAQAVADVLQAATEVAATIATSATTLPSFARSVERSDDDESRRGVCAAMKCAMSCLGGDCWK
jgi:hypothetical protein